MKISIQTLLLLIVLFALAMSGPIARHQTRMQIETLANSANGQIIWNRQDIFETQPTKRTEVGNNMLRQILGDRFGYHITSLSLELNESNMSDWNRLLQKQSALRGLTRLQLRFPAGANQFEPAVLSRLDDLQLLRISNVELNSGWITSIADVEDLEILWLSECRLNQATAERDLMLLADLEHLAWLEISKTALEPEQLARLRRSLQGVYISLD